MEQNTKESSSSPTLHTSMLTPSDFEAVLQSIRHEMMEMKSQIAYLKKENNQLRMRMDAYDELVESNTFYRIKQGCDDTSLALDSMTEGPSCNIRFKKNCNFCRPTRCLSCEHRLSMMPSIVLLLVKNDFSFHNFTIF